MNGVLRWVALRLVEASIICVVAPVMLVVMITIRIYEKGKKICLRLKGPATAGQKTA